MSIYLNIIGASSQICIDEFKTVFKKKTGHRYEKNDEKIYNFLEPGDEDKALNEAFKRAERMREPFTKEIPPSKWGPSTQVDLLVKMILNILTNYVKRKFIAHHTTDSSFCDNAIILRDDKTAGIIY